MEHAEGQRRVPAWGYQDVLLFISAVLPSFAVALILLRLVRMTAPRLLTSNAARILTLQAFMYVLLLGSLYLVVARYGEPFWRALGWIPGFRPMPVIMGGPLLAIGLSMFGVLLHTPTDVSEIETLITSRTSLMIIILFGVVLAPVIEETLFRGFLFPVLARSLGPALGAIATAIPFAILHGSQNHWAWQPILLIGIAGVLFAVVRHRTGSTAAAALLHAMYNATGFAGYAITHWSSLS
jgi:membrane protease YdiL (CAAX protease family)